MQINMHHSPELSVGHSASGREDTTTIDRFSSPWMIERKSRHTITKTSEEKNPFENELIENTHECCPNCGCVIDDNDKFCIFCGSRLLR